VESSTEIRKCKGRWESKGCKSAADPYSGDSVFINRTQMEVIEVIDKLIDSCRPRHLELKPKSFSDYPLRRATYGATSVKVAGITERSKIWEEG